MWSAPAEGWCHRAVGLSERSAATPVAMVTAQQQPVTKHGRAGKEAVGLGVFLKKTALIKERLSKAGYHRGPRH